MHFQRDKWKKMESSRGIIIKSHEIQGWLTLKKIDILNMRGTFFFPGRAQLGGFIQAF